METVLAMANNGEHILLVEDDPSQSAWISDYLSEHGFQVSIADRGDTAIELIKADMPDLVILDILLPMKNGFDVCKEVRAFFPKPILMVTACTEEADEVLGLELGADDYLGKPIRLRVLLARIMALLRRGTEHEQLNIRTFDKLRLEAESKTVYLDGTVVKMSVNEFEVLWLLSSNAGKVLSRNELITKLRGFDYDGFDRSMDIRISRLRKKLGDDPLSPYKIKTVRGKGYLFASGAWKD